MFNELYPMDETMFNDFLFAKWKWIVYVIETYLFHKFNFVYVGEAFITLNWKA